MTTDEIIAEAADYGWRVEVVQEGHGYKAVCTKEEMLAYGDCEHCGKPVMRPATRAFSAQAPTPAEARAMVAKVFKSVHTGKL